MQFVLIPRLISFLHYSVVLIRMAQVALQEHAGCADFSPDHSPPLFNCLTRFGAGCTTRPTQVVLVPLLFTTSATHCLWNVCSASQGSPQILLLWVLHQRIQDESPETLCVAFVPVRQGFVVVMLFVAQAWLFGLRDLSVVSAPPNVLHGPFLRCPSARTGTPSLPRPTGTPLSP